MVSRGIVGRLSERTSTGLIHGETEADISGPATVHRHTADSLICLKGGQPLTFLHTNRASPVTMEGLRLEHAATIRLAEGGRPYL